MKLAITADLHLGTRAAYPERYDALQDVLQKCKQNNVQILIIAGDLFDKDTNNPSPFEQEVAKAQCTGMEIIILPGNHDPNLSQSQFANPAIRVLQSGSWLNSQGISKRIFLLPYTTGTSMGTELAKHVQISDTPFVLISHGDWLGGTQAPNLLEPGSYMPLRSADVRRYRPEKVFLGHIHIPSPIGQVMYTGSPCPLDITETGARSFLIYDAENGDVKRIPVDSGVLNFIHKIAIIPGDDEIQTALARLSSFIDSQMLPAGVISGVNFRLILTGTCRNKQELVKRLRADLEGRGFRSTETLPDALSASNDPVLESLAEKVLGLIEQQGINHPDYPSKTDVAAAALHILYGE